MHWITLNLFSGRQLSKVAVLGVFCGSMWGCQSETATEPQQTTQLHVVEPGEVAEFTELSSDRILHQPELVVPSGETNESVPVTPLSPRASELFGQLSAPGLSIEEWDRAHAELLGMAEEAVPVLAHGLESTNSIERETAASTLALMGPAAKSATNSLKGALKDSSPFVRANAAAALVLIPGEEAVAMPVLVETLDARDPQLRQMAAMNLNVIGAEASPHVVELARILVKEQSPDVLVPVVQLLGRLGPSAAAALPQLEQVGFNQPDHVRAEVTHAIAQIQATSATNVAAPVTQ